MLSFDKITNIWLVSGGTAVYEHLWIQGESKCNRN